MRFFASHADGPTTWEVVEPALDFYYWRSSFLRNVPRHVENLSEYNSKKLATWIYGAKSISKVHKTKMKSHTKHNSARHLYSISANIKPADKTIEKEDLNPG
jgi:hypothetical protein